MSFETLSPELVMPGLSIGSDYLRLAHKEGLGVHVAFRPLCSRVTDKVIVIGGKIRVAYDATYAKTKDVAPLNDASAVANLKAAWSGTIKWANMNPERLSTAIALPLAVGVWDGPKFFDGFDATKLAKAILAKIEKDVGCPLENRRIITGALAEFYLTRTKALFHAIPSAHQNSVGSELIGVSGPLEVGEVYGPNVVSFVKKIAEKHAELSGPPLTNEQ